MRKQNPKWGIIRSSSLLIIVMFLGMAGTALAAGNQTAGGEGGRLVIEGPRTVGAQLTAAFDMGDYEVPPGQSVAINVDVYESPEGPSPRIIPGYPRTSMVFETPGTYVLNFRLNQICKTSCGGVAARPLMEKTETIDIAPANAP
jgi:hypothetical protein